MAEPARAVAAPPMPTGGQVVSTDASSLMEVISRAAADPSTDVDKLERLLGMYERITAKSAEAQFNTALNAAQAEMAPIRTDASNPQTKSRYASFPALDRALRPIYTQHGFSLSYDTGDGAPADHVRLVCYVAHNGGHRQTYHVDMPADGKGAKGGDVMTKTHAAGAAMTYGQRYLLKLIFNIAVGDDTDGNAADPRGGSAPVQAAVAAINACNTLAELKTWKTNNAKALDMMPSDQATAIVRHFNDRTRRLREATQ